MPAGRTWLVMVGASALALLAGCSSSGHATTTVTVTQTVSGGSSPADSTTPVVTPTLSHPLSFYAGQYTAIIAVANEQLQVLEELPENTSSTVLQADADHYITLIKATNATLLSSQWPPGVLALIQTEVADDAPVLADFASIKADESSLQRDAGIANTAANKVRLALGLNALGQ